MLDDIRLETNREGERGMKGRTKGAPRIKLKRRRAESIGMGRNITRRLTAELFRSCSFVVDVFRIGGGVGKGSLIVFKRSSCLNWE